MRLLSANHFFLPLLLVWTCLCVTVSAAKEKGKIIPAFTLKDVANRYPDMADQAQRFQKQLDKIIEHSKDFKRELVKNNIDPMVVHDYMTWEAANIVEIFRTEKKLAKPLPDGRDESARSRNGITDNILMSMQVARQIFAPFKYVIETVLLIVAARSLVSGHKAALDAIRAGWSRSLPFEAIIFSAKEEGEVIAASVLKDVANQYPDIADEVQQFQGQLNKIVEHVEKLKRELVGNGIDPMVVHEYMTREAAKIIEILRTELDKPLPDGKEERARYWKRMISDLLDRLEDAFVYVCVKSGRMSEQEARRTFAPFKEAVRNILFTFGMFASHNKVEIRLIPRKGDFVEKNPKIAAFIVMVMVCYVFPGASIHHSILSIFGFGPAGPVKVRALFPAPKDALDAVSAGWSRSLPFEAIVSSAKGKGKFIAASTLKDVASQYHDRVADQVQQFQEQLKKIVEHAQDLKGELVENSIDPMVVRDYMTREAANIVEKFRTEHDEPLPDGKDERACYRKQIIDYLFDRLEDAFAYICVTSGRMSEQDARQIFAPFKKAIRIVLFIVADFVEKHPQLARLMMMVVYRMLPESFILGPILSVFGFGRA
ncbi:hypothetical protein EST38_g7042 [Candolleomyces aberdarensis]|uniref:Uncharacterized protein n=1 Tax=Candolleomyces aberdarensis TaxID=2316362 RepID=A0A4Q2DI92_9AGAR|nr:hypothetical protein EST38_g7042 [Candolleomyces aberdarensis]